MIRQELVFNSPFLNAAGSLGFAPAGDWPLPEPQGAFITLPISLTRRTPAGQRGCLAYPGGLLLHTGLPNPGMSAILRRCSPRWQRSSLPVWAHIIPETGARAQEMVARLEGLEGVMAVELGLPPEGDAHEMLALIRAALGELPLVVSIPLHRVRESWLADLAGLELSALTIAAPTGALPDNLPGSQSSGSRQVIRGRLFGPALLPQVLAAVQTLQPLKIPLIAAAGIYRRSDTQALFAAGASAVQFDTALWKGYLLD